MSIGIRLAALVLIASCSGVADVASLLVAPQGCGALCRRTCCKPTTCLTMRGPCCCTSRAQAAAVNDVTPALFLPAPTLARDTTPSALLACPDLRLESRRPPVPHPPPRRAAA